MRQALRPGALGKPRGSGLGNTCKPMAVSFQCMTKFTTNKIIMIIIIIIINFPAKSKTVNMLGFVSRCLELLNSAASL